ncbi:hypothetical protein G7Y89_g12142 [Cudoniella acicularis]|uniref:Uncharacterized protein n=1 Tax=Cudoniella acicularis TaxID=354080 RepID=A0A8H4VXM8_9HELO|nr:hypothetical protein G7Y89_g12142 [Cudoniella acicularis]
MDGILKVLRNANIAQQYARTVDNNLGRSLGRLTALYMYERVAQYLRLRNKRLSMANAHALEYLIKALRRFIKDNKIVVTKNLRIEKVRISETGKFAEKVVLEVEVASPCSTSDLVRRPDVAYSTANIVPQGLTPLPYDFSVEGTASSGMIMGMEDTLTDFMDLSTDTIIPDLHSFNAMPVSSTHLLGALPCQFEDIWPDNASPSRTGHSSTALGTSVDEALALATIPTTPSSHIPFTDMQSTLGTLGTPIQFRRPAAEVQSNILGQNEVSGSSTGNSLVPPLFSPEDVSSLYMSGHHSATTSTARSTMQYTSAQAAPRRKVEAFVEAAAQSILRDDILEYVESELPRWIQSGFWCSTESTQAYGNQLGGIVVDTSDAASEFVELQKAYRTVCDIQKRINDDLIHSRMALINLHSEYLRACDKWQSRASGGVKKVGRRDVALIIDHILQHLHTDEWKTLSEDQRSTLRSQFHERKRYGKRWALLAEGLGMGVVMLCSKKTAAIVHNTSVTLNMLQFLVDHVKSQRTNMIDLLDSFGPLGDRLHNGQSYRGLSPDSLISAVKRYKPVG